ncbi:Gfo/Idh/MocA family oxidoreductase [Kribbella sp. NPDC051952]|uniref:Gfo/Idh/MocA family oxidoreductase n=1 Tax=Kribbella sp. NPDC051952 TaxID=3154851 RepID=UPI003438AD67
MRTDHGLPVVRLGLIGAGRIGTMHARNIARHVPGAELAAVADARPEAAQKLAARYGANPTDVDSLLKDQDVDAVVITSIAAAHLDLIQRAAAAGKPVWCEKPASLTLDEIDQAIAATERAGVPFQVGFNRRFAKDFAAARRTVDNGGIGTPQLMRSTTRDPGGPAGLRPGTPPWTIFRETLIHDFDLLLWLNPGARPVEIFAKADALVAPQYKADGLLDTAVVLITFDNGTFATAEANFSALYGYDVRAEVFGSKGMVLAGGLPNSPMVHYDANGLHQQTLRSDEEMFHDAYVQELAEFVDVVRGNGVPPVTGHDARNALEVALAAMTSCQEKRPVELS